MSLLLTFYGDDFTGSTDALNVLASAGIETVLFLNEPSDDQVARFQNARAIGISGISRSQSPQWMDQNLPRYFKRLQSLGAPVCHYKVCSTFDSAPHVGNIGRAAEIARAVYGERTIPVIIGAPALGRYVAFGNLFACSGASTYRIDRHPVMRHHPVTPMTEADLSIHLARQTDLSSIVIDHPSLHSLPADELDRLTFGTQEGLAVVDTIDVASQHIVGAILWRQAAQTPLFAIGSSGVEFSLVEHWRDAGLCPVASTPSFAPPAERILVVSGSCSVVNGAQIHHALANGFAGVPLDPFELMDDGDEADKVIQRAASMLSNGQSPLLYTATGPDTGGMTPAGESEAIAFNMRLGEQLGRILRELILMSGVRRAVVAGGDTSSHAARQLNLYALSYRAPLAPGCPLCTAHSDTAEFDGLELALKGGQMGDEAFFTKVLNGTL